MSKKKRSARSGLQQRSVPTPLTTPAEQPRKRRWLAITGLAVLVAVAAGYSWWKIKPGAPESTGTPPAAVAPLAKPATSARFVGATACAGCHAAENTAWQDSQHA